MAKLETYVLDNREAFYRYNESRKSIALEIIPDELRLIFQVIPVLLHINYQGIPGFVEEDGLPFGINCFDVDKTLISYLKDLFPSSKLWKATRGKRDFYPDLSPRTRYIESLLLMGSIGSVAQTACSDYDYWVCIDRNKFSNEGYKLLQEKLNKISEWCIKEYSMHTHFFIVDASDAYNDNFGSVDKESAGSSQGKILKEELYRTLILQAGKTPLWWIMPVGISDVEYKAYKKEIELLPSVDGSEFIDLGNVVSIRKEEFFGAALWQINKAMDYPFKSVLKMALLEIFLDESSRYDLLSNLIKKRVFESNNNLRMLDPYAVMLDSIIQFNLKEGREEEALLIKKCFYIKTEVNIKKIGKGSGHMTYKEKVMAEYINEWEWDQGFIEELNRFKEWKFKAVAGLGKEVHSFLRATYVRLSDRLKRGKEIQRKISDTDMTVLARKLFTIYENGKSKVEFLERAFDKGLMQESVTFCPLLTKNRKILWALFSGQIPQGKTLSEKHKMLLMKSSAVLLDLVSWIVYNKVCDKGTSMYLLPGPTHIELTRIRDVFFEAYDFFPPVDISSLKNSDLLERPKKLKFLIAVNFSSQPEEKDIKEISVFYTNSYGEFHVEHFASKDALGVVLEYMTEDSPKGVSDFSDYYRVFVPKGNYQKRISLQIDSKIKERLKRESYRY